MATSGKKGKKKPKTISLQNFLANGNSQPVGVTQVAKKVRNRDDSDDDETGALPQFFQLPTAPRANRIYEDDESIPHKPPFLAYITNLPFDIKEEDIYDFFHGYKIESVRLPREDGEYGRLRGFGYIQFETREDLINAISLPDPQIMNRRIRINVSSENDQQNKRSSTNRNRYEGFGNSSENKDSTNWRRTGGIERDNDNRDRRSGYGYNRDRDRNGDRGSRDASRETGSWRTENRPNVESTSPGRKSGFSDRYSGRKNDGYRNKKQEEESSQERPKLKINPRTLPLPQITMQPASPEEKKEELETEIEKDRAPTPEIQKPKLTGVPAEKIFGSAKPVDTASREKEIEERLEKERLEKLKKNEEEEKEKEIVDGEKHEEKHLEKSEKENKNTASWRKRDDNIKHNFDTRKYSPDRKLNHPPRRNDDRRSGNARDNRDRRDRDYNKGNVYDRDSRNMDNRDSYNRGGGRDDRNERGFIKERRAGDRDSRDYRDNRDHRDNRHRDDKPKPREREQRDSRNERSMPKYQQPQSGPILSTSNMYAVFQDEGDVSE